MLIGLLSPWVRLALNGRLSNTPQVTP